MNSRDDGESAINDNLLMAEGVFNTESRYTMLHLPDGKVIRLATALLLRDAQQVDPPSSSYEADDGTFTLPLIEERVEIGKRTAATGKVVLERHVHEYQEQLDVPLAVRTFDIERVVLNQRVETAPSIRTEGATVIYPVVEEQLVLTTQLILMEELRITRVDSERRDNRTVTLRREHIEVIRSSETEHSS